MLMMSGSAHTLESHAKAKYSSLKIVITFGTVLNFHPFSAFSLSLSFASTLLVEFIRKINSQTRKKEKKREGEQKEREIEKKAMRKSSLAAKATEKGEKCSPYLEFNFSPAPAAPVCAPPQKEKATAAWVGWKFRCDEWKAKWSEPLLKVYSHISWKFTTQQQRARAHKSICTSKEKKKFNESSQSCKRRDEMYIMMKLKIQDSSQKWSRND